MTTVSITLDDELLAQAEARARELNMTLEEFVIAALRDFLDSQAT